MSENAKKTGGFKDFVRKQLVTLKKNPQFIPLVMLMASFIL